MACKKQFSDVKLTWKHFNQQNNWELYKYKCKNKHSGRNKNLQIYQNAYNVYYKKIFYRITVLYSLLSSLWLWS